MGKVLLIAVAAIVGLIGLAMTACGAVFAAVGGSDAGIAFLIGILPGALLMWLAYWLFTLGRVKATPEKPPELPPADAG